MSTVVLIFSCLKRYKFLFVNKMQTAWTPLPVTVANQSNKLPIGGFCVVSTAQLRYMNWAHGPGVAQLELAQA